MAIQTMEKNSLLRFFEILKSKFFKIIILNTFIFIYFALSFAISTFLTGWIGSFAGGFLGMILGFIPFALGGPLYGAVTKMMRDFTREVPGFFMQDFLKALKDNWKQCLAISVIQYIVLWAIIIALQFYYANLINWFNKIAFAVCLLVAVFFLFSSYYLYMMAVTLKLKLYDIIKNSLIFTMLCFLRNVLLTVLMLVWLGFTVFLVFCAIMSQMSLVYGLVIAFVIVLPFGIAFYLCAFFTFPQIKKYILDPYYEKHPEETSDSVGGFYAEQEEKELPEFAYHNGKMVHRSALEEETVFKDKSSFDEKE